MINETVENQLLAGLFLRDKPAKILLGLHTSDGTSYATILSKDANCTYSHTIKILNILRDMGLVEFEKKGRIKRISLTESGADIAAHMEKMVLKFLKLETETVKSEAGSKKKTKK